MIPLYIVLAFPVGLAGAGFLAAAAKLRRTALRRREQASRRVRARIVEELPRGDRRPGRNPPPRFVYEFELDGVLHRALYTGLYRWRAGDTVEIFCDPLCPDQIWAPGGRGGGMVFGLYFLGTCWLLAGLGLLACGFLGIQ